MKDLLKIKIQRKKNKLLFLFFIFCIHFNLKASIPEAKDQFTKASEAYKNNDIAKAYNLFTEASLNYQSAELYYNLGNCSFKLNKMPEAILNYERALKMAPGDEDIDYNLKLANGQIIDKIDALPSLEIIKWWDNFKFNKGANYWGGLAIILLSTGFLLFALYKVSNNIIYRRIRFFLGCLMLILSMASLYFAYENKNYHNSKTTAIIFSPKVDIKSAPAESGTNVFVLHEGTKVFILNTSEEWFEIKISNGNRGWMLKKNCIVI